MGFGLQEERLSPAAVAALTTPIPLREHMASHQIQCMASGGSAPNFKFFFHAQRDGAAANSGVFLVEMMVNTALATANVKIKSDEGDLAPLFVEAFKRGLATFA